jgi:3'-phosphoadenosine 5'-phosphosulfate sulfotransferase (PAPS reductase)/FAD synthetase
VSVQHFIGVSGGKDSLRTAIEALDRFERRPPASNLPPRFLAADPGNEHPGWQNYIGYLETALGVTIEVVPADFSREFAVRRSNIESDWRKEKTTRTHSAECKARGESMTLRERMERCACPARVSPPVPEPLIQRALALLHPTGNPFLDLCMLKGRFPGAKSRFCTDRLKIEPMQAVKQPYLDQGINVIEWLGERAEESPGRAAKSVIQRIRHERATQVLYRPIHAMKRDQVFADIAARGILVNPLYDKGATRVGCWPCIMCGKDEIALLDSEAVDRLREWERLVGMVSRRQLATFFCAKMLPGETDDPGRAAIDNVLPWARTSRGGRQFDMFQSGLIEEARDAGIHCDRDAFAGCGD